MKFTKEEINLCKQIAETDRLLKLAKEGDWIRNEYGHASTELATSEYLGFVLRFVNIKHWFPLWTISDCLEYLEIECVPLKMQIRGDSYARLQGWKWRVSWGNPNVEEGKPWGGSINAPTLLEACLKAVLAVLVDSK